MLQVAEIGMASALGGLVGGCAAFRAGLASVSTVDGVDVMEEGDSEESPVIAHAHPAARSGFTGVGRLALLLSEALVDLATRVDLARVWSESPLLLALPTPDDRVDAEIFRDDLEGDAQVDAAARLIVKRAALAAGLPGLPRLGLRAFATSETGFATALREATRALRGERPAASVLVAAVDSFADPRVVRFEVEEGRIKTEHNPVGYMPGEAAVVALVRAAESGGTGVLVAQPAFAVDSPRSGPRPSDGRAISDCLAEALGALRMPAGPGPVTLVTDHDGTPARANELGMLELRAAARKPPLAYREILFPALGFGRTGVASAAVGLAVATRALARGYARSRAFAVLSASSDGARAVFAVTAAAG